MRPIYGVIFLFHSRYQFPLLKCLECPCEPYASSWLYDVLDRRFEGRKRICGECPIIDIAFRPRAITCKKQGIDPGKFKNADQWCDNLKKRPGLRTRCKAGGETGNPDGKIGRGSERSLMADVFQSNTGRSSNLSKIRELAFSQMFMWSVNQCNNEKCAAPFIDEVFQTSFQWLRIVLATLHFIVSKSVTGTGFSFTPGEIGMPTGINIRTYFNGEWHDGDIPVMNAADHGMWLGSNVFDGARFAYGLAPDLDRHCARVIASAEALMVTPTVMADEMVDIVWEGIKAYPSSAELYIRPMYWALDGGMSAIVPKEDGGTGFAICLEEIAMAPPGASATLTRTRFRRPVLEDAVVNAKAACLYPNNARMLAEARDRGFSNALVADALGNVAEAATANVFAVKDGEVFTPVANGTFLAGITRARHIKNLREDGYMVHEAIMSFEDFEDADEVFLSGNMMKVTPVTAFDDRNYQIGPVTNRARELYWDWAAST